MYKTAKLTQDEIDRLPSEIKAKIIQLKEDSENYDPDGYELFKKSDDIFWNIAQKELSKGSSATKAQPEEKPEPKKEPEGAKDLKKSKTVKNSVNKAKENKAKSKADRNAQKKAKEDASKVKQAEIKASKKQKAESRKQKAEGKKADSGKKKDEPKTAKKVKTVKKLVDQKPKAVNLLKNYLSWNGKKLSGNFLFTAHAKLQKLINGKEINSNSPLADEVKDMQDHIERVYNGLNSENDSIVFEIPNVKEIRAKINSYAIDPQKQAIYDFLNFYIYNQKKPKTKAEQLLKHLDKLNETKDLKQAKKSLQQYIENGRKGYMLNTELNGLASLAGIVDLKGLAGFGKHPKKKSSYQSSLGNLPDDVYTDTYTPVSYSYPETRLDDPIQIVQSTVSSSDGSINSMEMNNMKFKTIKLPIEFGAFIGRASVPFYLMTYGSKGSGKSTFGIRFAHALANGLNWNVKYIAKEEGINYTVLEKFRRLNALHRNIEINDGSRPLSEIDFTGINVVFIDSVNEMNLVPDDLKPLIERYPNLSIVAVFKARKDGKYLGDTNWQHYFQTIIHVEEGVADTAEKNRFGGKGTIKVY